MAAGQLNNGEQAVMTGERPVPAPRRRRNPPVAAPRRGRVAPQNRFVNILRNPEAIFEDEIERPREREGIQRTRERRGRRLIEWREYDDLDKNQTNNFMDKINDRARTSFYIRYAYSYWLRNIEDNSLLLFHHNRRDDKRWINNRAQAQEFLEEREAQRLEQEELGGSSTKWVFDMFEDILVKIIFTRPPLIGTGSLPDWLQVLSQGRHGIHCLDTYEDNLCLWRCMAVFQGARRDRCTQKVRELAQSFLQLEKPPRDCPKTSLDELEKVENHFNHNKPRSEWFGFRVFEPERQNEEIVWKLLKNPNLRAPKIITIGVYEGHAFLIKNNIEGLGSAYICPHCKGRFTKACNLQRYIAICSKGETVIHCPNKLTNKPRTKFEEAFFPKNTASYESIRWLEKEAKKRGIHIHHAQCGHGGEAWLSGQPVDGFHLPSLTVFEYHGCRLHCCPRCFPNRKEILFETLIYGKRVKLTAEEAFQQTQKKLQN